MTRREMEESPGDRAGEPALEVLLEGALGGDEEALSGLLALLESRYGRRILANLRRFRRQARTQTLEDVVQDSYIELVRRIREGELADLPAGDREGIVRYFQRLCDGRLANAVRARKSPVLARRKPPVPESLEDSRSVVPGEEDAFLARERRRALLAQALERLEPDERAVLERVLAGVPYAEIARELGKSEGALWLVVHHAKRKLLVDIASRSLTAKLELERRQEERNRVLSPEEVKEAVRRLPPELREAVTHVHLEGRPVEELARRLGERGMEKARVRLKMAYRSLAGRLHRPFPETFGKLGR